MHARTGANSIVCCPAGRDAFGNAQCAVVQLVDRKPPVVATLELDLRGSAFLQRGIYLGYIIVVVISRRPITP